MLHHTIISWFHERMTNQMTHQPICWTHSLTAATPMAAAMASYRLESQVNKNFVGKNGRLG